MAKRNYKRKRRRKISSWKKLRVSAKLKRRLRILALAVVVVFATIIVSSAVALYQFFTQPLAGAAGASGGAVVFPGGRFNLLLITLEDAEDPTSLIRELSLITLDANENEAFMVRLPLEAEVLVPQGFGLNRLSTVYALGALSKPRANLDLTALTVRKLLAVPIDGYIVTDASGLGQINQYLGDGWRMVRLLPNLLTEIRRRIKTNLTLPSLLKVGKFILRARASEDAWTISKEELYDWQHLDLELEKHFRDTKIVEERLKIQVLNGTEKPGLARHVARYVENLGGDVIAIGNFERTGLKRSFMVTQQPEAHTVKRLSKVLQIEEVGSPAEVLAEVDLPADLSAETLVEVEALAEAGERADLTIVLGLDWAYRIR